MKFIVNSLGLLKQLQLLNGVLNSNNTLPILDNFLFEMKQDELTLSASDLETSMNTRMDIQCKEEGMIAVPAKLLLDILKSLPDQPLTFDVDGKTFGIEITSDNGKYKLTGQNGDEFPKAPAMGASKALLIGADVLNRAISKTIFAAGNDDMRPIMSGVFFEIEPESVRFVATDAHKLVRMKVSHSHSGKVVIKNPSTLSRKLGSSRTWS